MSGFFSRHRHGRRPATPFPPAWRVIIARHVPYARRLTPAQRAELERHVRTFLDRKHIEGCGGLRLHDVHRVTIAAHAGLLMLGGITDCFPRLTTILVYPDEYVVDEPRALGGGIVSEGPELHAGHTQSNLGAVVVSWRDVLDGVSDPADGENVLFHELAHQLDFEDGEDNGVPRHADEASARRFAEVARREYERLCDDAKQGRHTELDPYGAENPAEFFAVATEAFFEIPAALRAAHPELYDVLAAYFRQDHRGVTSVRAASTRLEVLDEEIRRDRRKEQAATDKSHDIHGAPTHPDGDRTDQVVSILAKAHSQHRQGIQHEGQEEAAHDQHRMNQRVRPVNTK